MGSRVRKIFPWIAAAVLLAVVAWALRSDNPEPADYTFSNGTEIKSVDPAIVTGQPEGAIIRGIYEGLIDWDPKDLHPTAAVAESWTLSEDGRTYTFHLRDDARWSNGSLVTAADFAYSFRRFLDPMLGAEYVFLLYYVTNAEKYNKATVQPGDPVEVELDVRVPRARPFARNKVLHGTLVQVQQEPLQDPPTGVGEEPATTAVYTVEIDGRKRRFSTKPEQLDAADVERCNQVLLDFGQVGITVVDPSTLRIELVNPVPYFINLLGFYPLFPVNQECLETHGYPAWTRPENIVTNGPFVLHSRKIRDRIRMKRNPHYWDQENIHLDTIDALAVESQTTELNLYMTGRIDYFRAVPATIIPELLRRKRKDFQPRAYLASYYYEINIAEKGLDQRLARRVLSLAVDRREVVDKITRAGQIPAYRMVPPGIADYEEAKRRWGIVEREADPEANLREAQRLLAEAGYPNGKGFPRIELLYNTNDVHAQIAELLQSQWKEGLGVNVELVNKEWGSYLADRRNGAYFVARAGWIGDYADPNTFLELFFSDNPQNRTGWRNPQFDELIEKTKLVKLTEEEAEAVDQQVRRTDGWSEREHARLLSEAIAHETSVKRMLLFVEAEQLLIEECPMIPLYYYVSQAMVRPYVKGFYQNIQDTHPFKGMWIDQEEKVRVLREEGVY